MGRRQNSGSKLSLDSLMDTLTNVLGILVIILIFSLLDAGDAVKRIRGFVDDVSPEQLAALIRDAEEIHKLVEEHRKRLNDLETETYQGQMSLVRQKQLIDQLKADIAKLAAAKINVEELKKEVEQRRVHVETTEKKIAAQEDLIASLKARLAEIPASGPDMDAKVVNLPDPREAPKGAKPLVFLCRSGRVVPVNTEELQLRAQQVIKEAERILYRKDLNRVDCEKMAQLFEKRFVGDRYCRVKIVIGGDAKPYLKLELRPEAGDKPGTIGKGTSQFNRWIRGIDPQRYYLDFRVFSDSFAAYLEARNAAARQGLLAGWIAYPAEADYVIGIGADFRLTCVGREPPPPPRPAPQPDGPPRPPPPPDVVD
jgi:hypothetical protein